MQQTLLKVDNLIKTFRLSSGFLKKAAHFKAVDDISFEVFEGENLGIVGESGCGKSTTGRMIMRLLEPTEGTIWFDGEEISKLPKKAMRKKRRDIQMIFQNPYASLNPLHSVRKILEEPLIVHGIGHAKDRKEKVEEYLDIVGLNPDHAKRYPHQFSGGQRQRIGIARALMTNPKLIIADEPVAALDVSIQAQILNLMQRLQNDLKFTSIFIAHDLGAVRHISDRVAIMYRGKVVELARNEFLYADPLHPYTKALLSAVPIPDSNYKRDNVIITGDASDAIPDRGCKFQSRCPYATITCKMVVPDLVEIKPGHSVACHIYSTNE